jgi:hypothetical protein
VGGAGNDRYVVDQAGDVVEEAAGGRLRPRPSALLDWTLGAEVERLTLGGTRPRRDGQ